jgi:hypothetical protein
MADFEKQRKRNIPLYLQGGLQKTTENNLYICMVECKKKTQKISLHLHGGLRTPMKNIVPVFTWCTAKNH